MDFFHSEFYKNAEKVLQDIQNENAKKVYYPKREYNDNGDYYYTQLWSKIDNCKNRCWIMTYAMDSSMTANLTLRKLINAAKRGVNVVLFVDDLQQYTNKHLIQNLQANGGVFVSLNPTWKKFWQILNQEFFRRHHEKLVVVDDHTLITSSNIEANYGGHRYGIQYFYDNSLLCSGYVNTRNFEEHFVRVADMYNIKLNPKTNQTNEQLIRNKYALPPYFQIIRTHQPGLREIQDHVLKLVREAQKNILIVQPYYYPVRIFEKELNDALNRGVKVELITSAKRDQPVYRYIKNYLLLRNLFHENIKLYEYPETLLHMKGYLIDGIKYSIGSFNNDRWSWKLNNELNIIGEDQSEADQFKKLLDRCKSNSKEIPISGTVKPWRFVKMKFWELFIYLSEVMMSKNKYVHVDKYRYKRISVEWDDNVGNDF